MDGPKDYYDDTISTTRQEEVEHIKGCKSCRQKLKDVCYGDVVSKVLSSKIKSACLDNNYKHWDGDH